MYQEFKPSDANVAEEVCYALHGQEPMELGPNEEQFRVWADEGYQSRKTPGNGYSQLKACARRVASSYLSPTTARLGLRARRNCGSASSPCQRASASPAARGSRDLVSHFAHPVPVAGRFLLLFRLDGATFLVRNVGRILSNTSHGVMPSSINPSI